MPPKQVCGKIAYLGSIQRGTTVCYNAADLSNGDVDTGHHYKFTNAVKVTDLLDPRDAEFYSRNAKKLNVDVTGYKVRKKKEQSEMEIPGEKK